MARFDPKNKKRTKDKYRSEKKSTSTAVKTIQETHYTILRTRSTEKYTGQV